MSSSDPTYRGALNAIGFDPKDVSSITPNIIVDIQGTASSADLNSALSQTATFVTTAGTGGANPFVHTVTALSLLLTVTGTWANDAALASALNDLATCINTAGSRSAGQPYVDVDVAFERISNGSIFQTSHRT
jgi:hypothetical protein